MASIRGSHEPGRSAQDGDVILNRLRKLVTVESDLAGFPRAAAWLREEGTRRRITAEEQSSDRSVDDLLSALECTASIVEPEWSVAAYTAAEAEPEWKWADASGRIIHSEVVEEARIPRVGLERKPLRSALLAKIAPQSGWSGAVLFVDPAFASGRLPSKWDLRWLSGLFETAQRAWPVFPGWTAEEERREVARDLHDGVAQSLIAAELNLASLSRHAAASVLGAEARRVLDGARSMLRRETRRVRERIEELRSDSPLGTAERIEEALREFELESGIETTAQLDRSGLPSRGLVAHAVLQLVREGLSNVRRHSGATRVAVQVDADWPSREVRLAIEDNGCGFAFDGRRSLRELEAAGIGPRMIRERVRASGGRLTVTSRRGLGVRLEIALPLGGGRRRTNSRRADNLALALEAGPQHALNDRRFGAA